MKKVNYIISKARINRGILLAFIMLLMSSGSYTFSVSTIPEVEFTNTSSLLMESYSANLFGLKPFDLRYIKKETNIPKVIKTKSSVKIAQDGRFSIDVMAYYLHNNNPQISLIKSKEIARIYYEESKIEGINHDVAFSQMCLETGFLNFGGDVQPHQNNFCGLGVTGNGVKGLSFEDERKGIRAHIQHLKAYATTKAPKNKIIDSRFKFVKRGSAKHVDDLTGKWASDKNYGNKITNILNRIENYNYNSAK
ncbi:MAG: glucosaminidase [Marinilabiliales bacterium]|nr:MAG: glucosaminidase [Marinilabiliales bacterium]